MYINQCIDLFQIRILLNDIKLILDELLSLEMVYSTNIPQNISKPETLQLQKHLLLTNSIRDIHFFLFCFMLTCFVSESDIIDKT